MFITLHIPKKLTDFIPAKKAAKRLGITSSRLRLLASQGRVADAFFHKDKGWLFPKAGILVTPGKRGPAFGLKTKPATTEKTS